MESYPIKSKFSKKFEEEIGTPLESDEEISKENSDEEISKENLDRSNESDFENNTLLESLDDETEINIDENEMMIDDDWIEVESTKINNRKAKELDDIVLKYENSSVLQNKDPYYYFSLLLDEEFYSLILNSSNEYMDWLYERNEEIFGPHNWSFIFKMTKG